MITKDLKRNYSVLIELHMNSMALCNRTLRERMNFNKKKGAKHLKSQIAFDKLQIIELRKLQNDGNNRQTV